MWTTRDKTKPVLVLVLVDSKLLLQYHRRGECDETNKTEFLKGMKMMKC